MLISRCFKGFSRYIPVSVMKCASQPAVLSRGPRALIYFFSSQLEFPEVYDGQVERDQPL